MNIGNTPDNPSSTPDALPDALRWQLRGLHREQMPAHDLWPDIAVRLASPQERRQGRVPNRRWQVPAALAATLVFALGVAGWWQATQSPARAAPSLVQREAAGMTRQYQAALTEVGGMPTTASVALQPTFDELDRSARLILDALARDPDSQLLLEQLHRTYSHRLALARRAAIT